MKEFLIPMRLVLDGYAYVEAETEEAARFLIDKWDFEFDRDSAELVDFNITGKIEEAK